MHFTRLETGGGETPLAADGDNVVLGRQPGRGLAIDHPTVSREHARVFLRDGTLHVADLNSSNGTFVNGRRVTRAELRAGDVLRLGSVDLRVEPPPGAAAATGAMPPLAAPDAAPGAGDDDAITLEAPPAPAAAAEQRPAVPPATRRVAATSSIASRVAAPRIDPQRRGSWLGQDMAQQPFLTKVLLVMAALALAATLFYAVTRITEQVFPEPGATPPVEDALEKESDGGG